MLTRFYADNYRCFSSFELPLEPLSVLLGPNGSGKSTVVSLLARLRDFIGGRGTSLELFPTETLTRWDERNEQTFELGVRLDAGRYLYRLRLTHERRQALNKVVEETLTLEGRPLFSGDDQKIALYNDKHESKAGLLPDWHRSGIGRIYERPENKKLWAFRRYVETALVLSLNPALVTAVSAERQPVTIPKPDCSDFAGWLRYIADAEGLIRDEAQQRLASGGLPGFRVFQAPPSGDAQILQCVFQRGSSPPKTFRLDELSSGQIAMVILETALAVAEAHHGVLLLDEPGNFLALGEIQPLLTRLQDAALEGRYQVILTAHHPIAVDFLAAGHGLWLERDPVGPARIQPIHVAEDIRAGQAGVRISELIARGWLSGLGVQPLEPSSEADAQTRGGPTAVGLRE